VHLLQGKSRKAIARLPRVTVLKIKLVVWWQWRSVNISVADSGGGDISYINTPLCTVLSESVIFVIKKFKNVTIKLYILKMFKFL
jgi:hypothetical protein